MGYKRAGFYGYDILENIGIPRGIFSAQSIVPEFQHPKVGDELPISPAGGLVFYAIEPNRYLVCSGAAGWGGYTWALYPIDENHTRLVSRARFSHNEPMVKENMEFAIYFGSALIYLGAVVLTLLRPLTWRRGLAGLAAGAAWLITWYAPVSIWIGALLELLVLWVFRIIYPRNHNH